MVLFVVSGRLVVLKGYNTYQRVRQSMTKVVLGDGGVAHRRRNDDLWYGISMSEPEQ
jgi:hypothetical protein